METWEMVLSLEHEDMVRRIYVPGGYLYQVQDGWHYFNSTNQQPSWHPPIFVPQLPSQ